MKITGVRLIKIGNGFYINIPVRYIRDGNINAKKKHSILIKEEGGN